MLYLYSFFMTKSGYIDAAYLTDRGQVREHNEDFVASCEPVTTQEEESNGWLYVVCDGVGGADAGEIASQYSTERTIHHYLENTEISNWAERLRRSVEQAHNDLCKLIVQRNDDRRMGTTLVAAVVADSLAVLANVGDSRGYHVRDGAIQQVTKDHSLVAKLLEEGIISASEAESLNIGNIILQSIGSEQPPVIDLFPIALQQGDVLVLCSDGLTNHVNDDEIAHVVNEYKPSDAADQLVALANERGGFDNITVLVLQYNQPDRLLYTESAGGK